MKVSVIVLILMFGSIAIFMNLTKSKPSKRTEDICAIYVDFNELADMLKREKVAIPEKCERLK